MEDATKQRVARGAVPSAAPARTDTVTDVTVFFPCYNDAATIGGLVTCAARTIDALGIDGDIVVVNDGSSDESAEVLTAITADEPRLRRWRFPPRTWSLWYIHRQHPRSNSRRSERLPASY